MAERKRREPSWWQRYAGALAFIAVAILGSVYYSINSGRAEDAQRSAEAAHHSLVQSNKVVVEAARINCQNDRKFRLQYRERGRAVVTLLHVIVDQARDLRRTEALRERVRTQLSELRPFLHNIHIIPVPTCESQIANLKSALAEAERRGDSQSP